MRDKKNKYELSKETRQEMISSIQTYFFNERDEDLGDLSASLLLDFIIENLSSEFYNQGILDSYKQMSNSIDDLMSLQKY